MKSLFSKKLNEINDLYSGSKRVKSSVSEEEKIVLILPLSGRYETFLRFLNNFEDVVLRTNENVDLVVSLFVSMTDSKIASVLRVIDHLNKKYNRRAMTSIRLYGEFSRGIAIDKAVQSSQIKENDIIFLIDVDMLFQPLTLRRIRENTIMNKQIYLPIVFSEFNPGLVSNSGTKIPFTMPLSSTSADGFLFDYERMSLNYQFYVNSSKTVNNDNGYFREFGYGLASIYKCDIMNSKINGFVTDVKGWGLEDVKFLEKILTTSHQVQNQLLLSIADGTAVIQNATNNNNLDVFRAPDESLIHIFHQIECDRNLEKNQYKMCLGTKSNTLGNYRLMKEKYFLKRDFKQFLNEVRAVVVND